MRRAERTPGSNPSPAIKSTQSATISRKGKARKPNSRIALPESQDTSRVTMRAASGIRVGSCPLSAPASAPSAATLRSTQVGVAGDVEHGVHHLGQRAQERSGIRNVADDPLRGHALQVFQIRAGAVQRDHLPSLAREFLDQVQPDEAGGAGDEGKFGHGALMTHGRGGGHLDRGL